MANSTGGGGGGLVLYSAEELRSKFGWEEYAALPAVLLASVAIGAVAVMMEPKPEARRLGQRRKSGDDHLLGIKKFGAVQTAMALVCSSISSITLLGTPAEVFVFGTQFAAHALCFPLVVLVTNYFFVPKFFEANITTSYEYLERRFNKTLRMLASLAFIVQWVVYMAIAVFAPALAISEVTGFDIDICCGLIFVCCVIYTTFGGIQTVMWTNTFQVFVMFSTFVAVTVKGTLDAGGPAKVFHVYHRTGRVTFFDMNPDPTERNTFWSLVVGGFFLWMGCFGTSQAMVQRYTSVPSVRDARRALWLTCLGTMAVIVLCSYAGMVIFSYYKEFDCDPIKSEMVTSQDQVFPLFAMQVMGDVPFVTGLFISGVFCGALFCISPGLNALATATIKDFVSGLQLQMSDRTSLIVSQALSVFYGALCYACTLPLKHVQGVLEAAYTTGILDAPVLGVFVLGMFFPRATARGALFGLLSSFAAIIFLGVGHNYAASLRRSRRAERDEEDAIGGCPVDPAHIANNTSAAILEDFGNEHEEAFGGFWSSWVFEISYLWFSMISFFVCVIVGVITSLLCPEPVKEQQQDDDNSQDEKEYSSDE